MSHLAAYVWTFSAWLFLCAVLLKRWREHERHDAEVTQEVLDRLLSDTTNAHIWDA